MEDQNSEREQKKQFKIPEGGKNLPKEIIPQVLTASYSQRKECIQLKIDEKTERSRRWRETEQNSCFLEKSRWFSVGKNTNRIPVVNDLVEPK